MKILFIKKGAGDVETEYFTRLGGWIEAISAHECGIVGGGNPSPIPDPDIVVTLHGHNSPQMLQEMGITTSPKRVCYLLGQSRPEGWAVWGAEFEEYSDAIWAYGVMNQQEKLEWMTIEYCPFPFDIEDIVDFSSTTVPPQIRVARVLPSSNILGRFWYKTIKPARDLRALGYEIVNIVDLSRSEALTQMAGCDAFLGTFNTGNLGKSELEAMTMGLAGIGRLSDTTRGYFETLGANLPYVSVTRENISTIVQNITPTQIKAKGAQCRQWMATNYTHQKIAQYWVNKLEALP